MKRTSLILPHIAEAAHENKPNIYILKPPFLYKHNGKPNQPNIVFKINGKNSNIIKARVLLKASLADFFIRSASDEVIALKKSIEVIRMTKAGEIITIIFQYSSKKLLSSLPFSHIELLVGTIFFTSLSLI